jgi:hypothetical protein
MKSFQKIVSIATAVSIASASACATEVEGDLVAAQEPTEEGLAFILPAIPILLVVAEQVLSYVAIGGSIALGGYTLYSVTTRGNQFTAQDVDYVASENATLTAAYNTPVFNDWEFTPDHWVRVFNINYASRMLNVSRSLRRTANDRDHRNQGGCVLATINGKNGTYGGGARYTSQFDVIAAQFVAGSRAYLRCSSGSNRVVNAWLKFFPTTSLPSVDLKTFIYHTMYTGDLLNALLDECPSPSFALTLDQSRCQ